MYIYITINTDNIINNTLQIFNIIFNIMIILGINDDINDIICINIH